MVNGAAQKVNISGVVAGDRVVFTRYKNCSEDTVIGPANPDKTQVYNITAPGTVLMFDQLFTSQVVTFHPEASAGQWRFCVFMHFSGLWLTVNDMEMTIIPKPTFYPLIGVAGSVTPLTIVNGANSDYVVIQYGGCINAHLANNTGSSHTRQTIVNQKIFTNVLMTSTLSNHSFQLVLCYATAEGKGDSSDDYSALDIQLNQVPPVAFACQTCNTSLPHLTVVGTPQDFVVTGSHPSRGDQIMWMKSANCLNAPGVATHNRSRVYDLTSMTQIVTLHTTAEPGNWQLCMRPSVNGLWSLVNEPVTHLPLNLTIRRDVTPVFAGTKLYYVAESAAVTLQDLTLIDPDHVYRTKNLFLVTVNCSNGTFTLGSQTGLTLLAASRGIAVQTVAFRATLENTNAALAAIGYTVAGRLTDKIRLHVYDYGSITTPMLSSNTSITTMYNCDEASAPRVASARFDNAVAQFMVTFDRITTMAGQDLAALYPCWFLFGYETYQRLGVGAVCTFTSTVTLQVNLGIGTTLHPGDVITWKDRQIRACATSYHYLTGTSVLAPPENPMLPHGAVIAPSFVGACDALKLDGSGSYGYGGLPLTYRWDLLTNDTANYTGAPVFPIQDSVLTIGSSDMHLFEGLSLILFRFSITDYLGQTASKEIRISKSHVPLPLVFIAGNSATQQLSRALKQRLYGHVELSSCAKAEGSSWTYQWTSPSHPSMTTVLSQSIHGNTRATLVIPANSMTSGDTYIFRLTVASAGNSSLFSYSEALVYAKYSAISALILGGDRRASTGRSIDIVAGGIDPDSSSDSWVTAWTCALSPKMSSCVDNDGSLLTMTDTASTTAMSYYSTITIAANTMPPGSYVFSAVLSKGNRTASSVSARVELVMGYPPVTSITLPPSLQGLSKVNRDISIRLFGSAIAEGGVGLNYLWSCRHGDEDFALTTGNGGNTLTPLNGNVLVLKPSSLTEGLKYTFTFTASGTGSATGYSEVSLLMNVPPSGGSLTVSPTEGTAANTTFTLTTTGWMDDPEDLPLMYLFSFASSATQTASLGGMQATSSTSTQLPTGHNNGQMNLFVDAYDLLLSSRRVHVSVNVQLPKVSHHAREEFVTTALTSAFSDALARGDAHSVAQSAVAFADILNVPADPSQNETRSSNQVAARKDLRGTMVTNIHEALSFMDLSLHTNVASIASSMDKVLAVPGELDMSTQSNAVDLFATLVPSADSDSVAVDLPMSTYTSIVSSLGNIAEASESVPMTTTGTANTTNTSNHSNSTSSISGSRRLLSTLSPTSTSSSRQLFAMHPTVGPLTDSTEKWIAKKRNSRRLLSASASSQGCGNYGFDSDQYTKLGHANQRNKYNASLRRLTMLDCQRTSSSSPKVKLDPSSP
jgi:hypothetical protein